VLLMRRYGWTPEQLTRLEPLWRTRLLLVEHYEAQVRAERERKQRTSRKR